MKAVGAKPRGIAVTEVAGKTKVYVTQFLAQLVANLVDNALKHGASGGAVERSVRKDGGMAEIAVADRGPGIPEEQRAGALKRFGRLDAARTTSGLAVTLTASAPATRSAFSTEWRLPAP